MDSPGWVSSSSWQEVMEDGRMNDKRRRMNLFGSQRASSAEIVPERLKLKLTTLCAHHRREGKIDEHRQIRRPDCYTMLLKRIQTQSLDRRSQHATDRTTTSKTERCVIIVTYMESPYTTLSASYPVPVPVLHYFQSQADFQPSHLHYPKSPPAEFASY
jgi:hypothetical protein